MEEVKVPTIGSKSVVGVDDIQTGDALQQKAQKAAHNIFRKKFKSQFLQVYDEIKKKGKTIQEIREEIDAKKSFLSKSAREFALDMKDEAVERWIRDYESGNYYAK